MPNWTTTRLTISGSQNELGRFEADCIRVPRDGSSMKKCFDFDSLLPAPTDVLSFGYDGEASWSKANWGTRSNSSNFSGGYLDKNIYDAIFDTAWSCPEQVLRALAAAYPALSGSVIFIEPAHQEAIVGAFTNGIYESIGGEFDEDCETDVGKLVYGALGSKLYRETSALALLASVNKRSKLDENVDLMSRICQIHALAEELHPYCTIEWC